MLYLGVLKFTYDTENIEINKTFQALKKNKDPMSLVYILKVKVSVDKSLWITYVSFQDKFSWTPLNTLK